MENLRSGRVTMLLGARRVGKTAFIRNFIQAHTNGALLLNGEDITVHEMLERRSAQRYRELFSHYALLIIDEAQKIPHIGAILKLIVDEIPTLKIIVTGSSAFDIARLTGEPLTGRQKVFHLFPFSEAEITTDIPQDFSIDRLNDRLVFGGYPELLDMNPEDKSDYLRELINSYLLKDILVLDSVKNPHKMFQLLKLIAFQIGHDVSLQELGRQLSMSKNTVERYLELLCKIFVLYRLGGYSRNMRKEVVKSSRWYFYDNGIRNALIANLNTVNTRNDIGQLWENYLVGERLKRQSYERWLVNNYFWRTYDRQEIDWVEERNGRLSGYEFKWNSNKKSKAPPQWTKAYPDAFFEQINPQNYRLNFLTENK